MIIYESVNNHRNMNVKGGRKREAWEVENFPEGEKEELVELYIAKGVVREDAQAVTDIISRNKKAWIDIMMVEELGITGEDESPVKNALVTFFSFAVFGFIPLLAYIAARLIPGMGSSTFITACAMTALTLFVLGALKVRITGKNWAVSGLEMLVLGGITAAAAYGVGTLLAGLA